MSQHSRPVAVVTGAAQGLGQAFAVALAGSGYDVATLDVADAVDTADLVRSRGSRFHGTEGDAADASTVAEFAEEVRTTLGSPCALVNNVGYSPYRSFDEETVESWHEVLRINLDSAFLATRAFLADLRAAGKGRIVNLSSSVVGDPAACDMVAYTTAKAGVIGLTRALATELGPDGITVNCIAPGIVLTPDIEARASEAKLAAYRARQAVKQLATPDDMTSTLLHLLDARSGQVTGTVQAVNGGRVWW